jgi:hypothetical protein
VTVFLKFNFISDEPKRAGILAELEMEHSSIIKANHNSFCPTSHCKIQTGQSDDLMAKKHCFSKSYLECEV